MFDVGKSINPDRRCLCTGNLQSLYYLQVLQTDIVFDVGKSINPGIDIGQIEGAFVQVSHSLYTTFRYYRQT